MEKWENMQEPTDRKEGTASSPRPSPPVEERESGALENCVREVSLSPLAGRGPGRGVRLTTVRAIPHCPASLVACHSQSGPYAVDVNPIGTARGLRRRQTKEEKQLWHALRAGRFAGFKFRRQHTLGEYVLDFYCPLARLSVELDGFQHGLPTQFRRDVARAQYLDSENIEELRFWNRQWRTNREGVLLELWHALHRRTGCVKIMRKVQNHRYVPPKPEQLAAKPLKPPMWYPRQKSPRARPNPLLQGRRGSRIGQLSPAFSFFPRKSVQVSEREYR